MNRTELTAGAQASGAIKAMAAVGQAIRELGRVPSGHLYATLMGLMSLASYEKMIDTMAGAGVIRRDGDVLVWIDETEAR